MGVCGLIYIYQEPQLNISGKPRCRPSMLFKLCSAFVLLMLGWDVTAPAWCHSPLLSLLSSTLMQVVSSTLAPNQREISLLIDGRKKVHPSALWWSSSDILFFLFSSSYLCYSVISPPLLPFVICLHSFPSNFPSLSLSPTFTPPLQRAVLSLCSSPFHNL